MNANEQTALAISPRENMTALQVVENEANLTKLGQTFAQSGFFGQVSASTATAALVNCVLEGLSPVQYRAKYHTFDNGQTGVKSDYIQREFHKLGGEWEFKEWTAEVCDMVFTYKGHSLPFRVTLDEFKANGVAMSGNKLKTNWAKFPREMLKARCMATAIRAICPEALEGMYTQEEVADFERVASAPTPPSVKASPTPVAASVSPSPLTDEVAVDFAVCPCGSVKGKRWSEIPTETLEKILATPEGKAKSLTASHRNAIIAEIFAREAAAYEEATEAIEPDIVEG